MQCSDRRGDTKIGCNWECGRVNAGPETKVVGNGSVSGLMREDGV